MSCSIVHANGCHVRVCIESIVILCHRKLHKLKDSLSTRKTRWSEWVTSSGSFPRHFRLLMSLKCECEKLTRLTHSPTRSMQTLSTSRWQRKRCQANWFALPENRDNTNRRSSKGPQVLAKARWGTHRPKARTCISWSGWNRSSKASECSLQASDKTQPAASVLRRNSSLQLSPGHNLGSPV